MAAIKDVLAPGHAARELDRRLDRFRAGIGEKGFIQIRRELQQAFGEQAGQRGDIHLDEIRQIRVEDALQCRAHGRMIAADSENTPAAQKIEVARPRLVEKILAGPTLKRDIETDGAKSPHHHIVQMTGVEIIALALARLEQGCDIERLRGGVMSGFLRHRQLIHKQHLRSRRRASDFRQNALVTRGTGALAFFPLAQLGSTA